MKAFELTTDGLEKAGTICFRSTSYDYGLAADDTRITGREHKSFTKNAFGRGPTFTHPIDGMKEVEIDDIPVVDDEHSKNVCKVGQGAKCCKYLTMGTEGWSCEKLSEAGNTIDRREDMVSKGDNCPGRTSR